MAKKKSVKSSEEAAGWLFWLVSFVIFIAPCIWGAWQVARESATPAAKIVLGVVATAMAASLLSWAVNSVYQYRNKKRRIAERKKAKKKKK